MRRFLDSEVTYAWDKMKVVLPVLHDFDSYNAVMKNPQKFVQNRQDITEVVPKLGAHVPPCEQVMS